ncbi:hypothetical protein M3223_19155 [Paenibacillus pasadenensis]|uniref:hypothetical protein n=1 Tax=Paenibacillus pasadenensis TaxID=217090 RepID=UPI0020416D56|nr:hypothetical protein [Paenibacillus pasadenensis]MCM3749474.1 hypothetical protein [Paenibacillus pasadenensis]
MIIDNNNQDSESLAKEGTRYGFKQVLGREPTEDEFAQLVGRPVPVVYKEWFNDELANQILERELIFTKNALDKLLATQVYKSC